MSYYTYFKLKPDFKKPEFKESFYTPIQYKTFLNAYLISIFGNEKLNIETRYFYIKVYLDKLKDLYQKEAITDILQVIENSKDKEYDYNKWSRNDECDVESFETVSEDFASKLLNLSYIPFIQDKYSDTSDTQMEYLENEYTYKIREHLNDFEDLCYTYAKNKFLIENCTSMTEDEKYENEELVQDKNIQTDGSREINQ